MLQPDYQVPEHAFHHWAVGETASAARKLIALIEALPVQTDEDEAVAADYFEDVVQVARLERDSLSRLYDQMPQTYSHADEQLRAASDLISAIAVIAWTGSVFWNTDTTNEHNPAPLALCEFRSPLAQVAGELKRFCSRPNYKIAEEWERIDRVGEVDNG